MSKPTLQLNLRKGQKVGTGGIVFHFGGKVVTLPSKNSMPLAHAFGHHFFIERSPSDNDPAFATQPIPAFMVPKNIEMEEKPSDVTQLLAMGQKEVQVTVTSDKHEYQESNKLFEKPNRNVNLQVHYLSLLPTCIVKDKKDLIVNSAKLVRPIAEWDEELETKVAAAKKSIKDATKKKRKKDAPGGGSGECWEKIAGHLLK